MTKKPKRLKEANQLAQFIIQAATGEIELLENKSDGKNPAAVALGRLGGLKGGVARAQKLSASQRKEIAAKAAKTRWEKKDG